MDGRTILPTQSLITLREAASRLGVSYDTARSWVADGALPRIALQCRRVLIDPEDVVKLITTRRSYGKQVQTRRDLVREVVRQRPEILPIHLFGGRTGRRPVMTEVERQKLEMKQRGIGLPPKGKRYFSELLDDLDNNYATNGRKSSRDLIYRGEIIRQSLGGLEVYPTTGITTGTIVSFRDLLKSRGLSNGTVNRYLAVISRAFSLALENEKVTAVPKIRRLKEAEPRTNWWRDDETEQFIQAAPEYLRRIVVFAACVSRSPP